MDTLENKTPAQSEISELREQVESLRHLVGSVLILLLVVSGTINLFLYREWKTSRSDLANFKPQAANAIAAYQKNEHPFVQNFITKMIEYGQTHADFVPILNKYPIPKAAPPPTGVASPVPPVPGAAAPATGAPAPAPQKK